MGYDMLAELHQALDEDCFGWCTVQQLEPFAEHLKVSLVPLPK